MTTLIIIIELHPVTEGSRKGEPQLSTGLSSWSAVAEKEEGEYEQRGQDYAGETHRR